MSEPDAQEAVLRHRAQVAEARVSVSAAWLARLQAQQPMLRKIAKECEMFAAHEEDSSRGRDHFMRRAEAVRAALLPETT